MLKFGDTVVIGGQVAVVICRAVMTQAGRFIRVIINGVRKWLRV